MQTNLEQVIEIVDSLPDEDRENLRKWLEKRDTEDFVKTTNQTRTLFGLLFCL